jgi:hypothetical protein
MKKLIAFLGICTLAHAVGTVQQSTQQVGNSSIYTVSMYWTGDSVTGTVPVTLIQAQAIPIVQGYRVINIETVPGSPAPTNNYSITLLDTIGVDVLAGAAANVVSSANAQGFAGSPTSSPIFGSLSLSITGQAVAGAKGTVLIYLAPFSQVIGLAPTAPSFPAQGANLVYASPCGSSGSPGFRALCATDLTLAGLLGSANTWAANNTFTGAVVDAHTSTKTLPNRSGTGSPVGRDNCATVGETYFQTDASAGFNNWACTVVGSPGTWTLESGTLPSGTQLQFLRIQPNTGNNTTLQFSTAPSANSADYNYPAQTPGGSISIGSNTITLTPCPLGVNGTDTQHYYYLSAGTGTAESALSTGGTCTSGAATGTITLTAANTHTGAWTIQSMSAGIKEAQIAGASTIILPKGVLPINGILALPTTVSLIGQSGSTNTSGNTNTVLSCAAAANPCLNIADGLGTATNQGIGTHSNYQLYGSGAGTGLWIGGDPSSVFAPSAWTGSYTRYTNIAIQNFATALELRHGNFVSFYGCSIAGTTLALYIPADQGGALQPVDFYGTILSSAGSTAIQMDSNSFLTTPIRFFGGQVSGAITGLGVDWESYDAHYEPNINNSGIVNISATGTHRVVIEGGILAIHGTALTNMLGFTSTGTYTVWLKDTYIQDDSGMTTTNLVNLGSASAGSTFYMSNNYIAPAGVFTNLFTIPANFNQMTVNVSPQITAFNAANTVSAATTTVFIGTQTGYPTSQAIVLLGATVGGGGITAVSGLLPGQTGILTTVNAQTFTAGATIGNTITTTAGLPYTYYFDGTKIWVK